MHRHSGPTPQDYNPNHPEQLSDTESRLQQQRNLPDSDRGGPGELFRARRAPKPRTRRALARRRERTGAEAEEEDDDAGAKTGYVVPKKVRLNRGCG